MRLFGYLIIFSAVILSCNSNKSIGSDDLGDETKLLIAFEQINSDGGNNPDFKIELYSNKQMYLTANKNIDKTGKYLRTVQNKEFNNILEVFTAANFSEFKDEYTSEPSATPIKTLYYYHNGKEKKVKYSVGEPEKINELELLMQSFLDRVGWEKMSW